MALTAAKVHALIKYIPTGYTLVLFAGMNTLFLSIVHHLQIPKLKTTKLTSLLLLLLFVSLDTASVYLLNRHYAPEPPARQKLSIPPKQDSSNIAGSHIVRVVPPTLIKLNPNSTQYCLLSVITTSHLAKIKKNHMLKIIKIRARKTCQSPF